MNSLTNTREFVAWVNDLKSKIKTSQIKATLMVNAELILLYWDLGKSISEKVENAKWGASVVDLLSKELQDSFPNQKGFSRSNLFSMKKWYEFYLSLPSEKVQQLVGQIPWGHNILIISGSKNVEEALFYIEMTINNGWSRSILTHQMGLQLFERKGKALTNFESVLDLKQSGLANEILKDPYKFDFLTLQEKAVEKDIEEQLVNHITSFLLELGSGFSYVGRQVSLKIDNLDYRIDLLFYHIRLKCYVVVELKTNDFKPEYAGKLNFYLSAVDDQMKGHDDNPTIGLLLCKSKSKVVAEYALRGMSQPMGIAEYQLIHSISNELKPQLPTIEKLEEELRKSIKGDL